MSDLEGQGDLQDQVKQALRHFHSVAYLGQCPLAACQMVRERLPAGSDLPDPIALGQSVQGCLDQAIDTLKPSSPLSLTAPEWRAYHILDRVFRQGNSPKHVYDNVLSISRSHYYRELESAIARVVDLLCEWEGQARHARRVEPSAPDGPRWASRLPPPTYTRLFGVQQQIAAVVEALQDPDRRWLIVVDGMGGAGKTALAREAASQALREGGFVDLVWETAQRQAFDWGEIQLSLEPALTLERLLNSIALQMGLPHLVRAPSVEKRQALQIRLRECPCLLVVDNLETAQDYQAIVQALWALTNPTKVLLTSRHRLDDYSAVTSIHLHPLERTAAGAFIHYHALERGVQALEEAGEHVIDLIYQASGGNPLAIKLVIGQAARLPLDRVVDHMVRVQGDTEQLYRFLYWASWQILSEPARKVLLSMPYFSAHGGQWEAVAAISNVQDEVLVQAMDELVGLCLLDVGEGVEKRYSIHQLTRNFVLSELVGPADGE